MNDAIYSDTTLERAIHERFGIDTTIGQVIVKGAAVSRTAQATVFLSNKKQLFVYISGNSRLLLGDVTKIISRMGLKADSYFPPINQPDYFNSIGLGKFRQVFPGRTPTSDDELRYYRTLAPYNPALVLISEIKNGEIYCYDSDSRSSWRTVARFTYRRIQTS